MRAMILAAGVGRRMQPLTDKIPKPLLRVKGKALIDYHLDALRLAGVREVIVNVHHHAEQVINHIRNREDLGFPVDFCHESELLETAGGIVNALELLGGEPFVVISSDVFTDYDLRTICTGDTASAHLVMVDNPLHHSGGDFSLGADGYLGAGEPKFTYSGIGLYHPGFFSGLAPGSRKLRELLDVAVAAREVTGEHYQGRWDDVGTPARLAELNR